MTHDNGENSEPLGTVSDGRGAAGRFAKGNHFARGNPHAKKMHRIRAELFRAIKPGDVKEAVERLIEQAKGGDRFALAELLDRTLGRPTTVDIEERLAALEMAMADAKPGGRSL